FRQVDRQGGMADPCGQGGKYAPGQGPHAGLAIARMLAMITYQSEEAMELRFARRPVQQQRAPSPSRFPDWGKRFSVENYRFYQGTQLVRRFDANSYLYISRAMDL